MEFILRLAAVDPCCMFGQWGKTTMNSLSIVNDWEELNRVALVYLCIHLIQATRSKKPQRCSHGSLYMHVRSDSL